VFPRDIVCLRNISKSTLHKGDGDDDDDDDDDDNNNNNNNNTAEYPTDISGVRKLFTRILTEDIWRHYVPLGKVRNHLIVWPIAQFNRSFPFYRPSKAVELSKK